MADSELAQIELFAEIDELTRRLREFVETNSPWEPLNHCRAILRRLLGRVETLRIRLEAPLVVATFGGTGVGKSALVNALVGRECTRSGRERPTTTLPALIAHPDTKLDSLGMPLDDFELVRIDAPILRDIVIVDCPDPDTTERETANTNLWRLHKLLPHCDVLLFVSTQQKYRSARVGDELQQAAEGCRLLFVQTHADRDSDIREDWRRQLAEKYAVPEVFFVDSLRAMQDQQAGRRPSGDFARLQDLLTSRIAASQRIHVRRANLLDLIHTAIGHCREHVAAHLIAIEKLEAALESQRQRLHDAMTARLREELVASQGLWERRLLTSVTERWGTSPFSSMLRAYSGLGNLIASATLWRARSSVQMALIGMIQGTRWLTAKQQERDAESNLQRVASSLGLEDDLLRESQLVLSGFLRDAKLTALSSGSKTVQELRQEA
ncbi:MAG TPA: GTPase, partial [Planctomycetaceae bacterium]|nr:GTPase [Planctomycetaceae bacterium]